LGKGFEGLFMGDWVGSCIAYDDIKVAKLATKIYINQPVSYNEPHPIYTKKINISSS
jgi:hypothetical protein